MKPRTVLLLAGLVWLGLLVQAVWTGKPVLIPLLLTECCFWQFRRLG